jgi:hypothetical protein
VHKVLPEFLHGHGVIPTDKAMPERTPLTIQSSEMQSFKESWVPENCLKSLQQSDMYEAGGNLCWIIGETSSSKLPLEDTPFQWLTEYDERGMFVFQGRIKFPVVMECHVPSRDGADEYPRHLFPLGGHPYMYAWYYSVWKALGEENVERCKMLFECALTTTICVRVSGSLAELAELSSKFSERVRADTSVSTDSFFTFADKVVLMSAETGDGKPHLADLQKKKIRYNNALVNLSMVRAITQIAGLSQRARDIMAEIDLRFGREMLSSSYAKIRAMLGQASSFGRQGVAGEYSELVEWTLESLLITLRRGEIEPAQLTYDSFNKSRDGKPSWIAVACTQRVFVLHMRNIATNLADVDPKLAATIESDILPNFASPTCFHNTFPVDEVAADGMPAFVVSVCAQIKKTD